MSVKDKRICEPFSMLRKHPTSSGEAVKDAQHSTAQHSTTQHETPSRTDSAESTEDPAHTKQGDGIWQGGGTEDC